jgi:hypothetical protein
MNKIDKLVEDRIQAEGWIKLLPTEKCETTQPHRFRYAEITDVWTDDFDGSSYPKNYQQSISIIQYGALIGVYQGPGWKSRYAPVDWDEPECNCKDCLLTQGIEEIERTSKAVAAFACQLEGAEPGVAVDIAHLQVEQADNGYKQVTFYYKIDE